MAHGIKLACATVALLALLFTGSGCTSMLYESNQEYVQKSREFQRANQKLHGTYVGMESCDGTLCEVYQFESPFRGERDQNRLNVLIPVYSVSEASPIEVYETTEVVQGEEPAELWFWSDKTRDLSSIPCTSDRRIDILWTGRRDCALVRRIPNGDKVSTGKWKAEVHVPWNKRSRMAYVFRHCAYAGTIPADIAAGAGIVVAGAGYVTLLACIYCPCAVEVLVHAIH